MSRGRKARRSATAAPKDSGGKHEAIVVSMRDGVMFAGPHTIRAGAVARLRAKLVRSGWPELLASLATDNSDGLVHLLITETSGARHVARAVCLDDSSPDVVWFFAFPEAGKPALPLRKVRAAEIADVVDLAAGAS